MPSAGAKAPLRESGQFRISEPAKVWPAARPQSRALPLHLKLPWHRSALNGRGLHLHCARKQNIVLQVHVLVKIRLELAQFHIQRAVTGATVRGSRIVRT